MASCYLCKNITKERTVNGFFDKSNLNQTIFADLPEVTQVHLACSLLYKETNLEFLQSGIIQVRGLENILRYNDQTCMNCRKTSSDYRQRPFILNCHHNNCTTKDCHKKDCQQTHCAFVFDIPCMKTLQVQDFEFSDEGYITRIKLFCKRHSKPSQQSQSLQTYSDVVNFINKTYFPEESTYQQQVSPYPINPNKQQYSQQQQQQQQHSYNQAQYPNSVVPPSNNHNNYVDMSSQQQQQQQYTYKQQSVNSQQPSQPQVIHRQNSGQVYPPNALAPQAGGYGQIPQQQQQQTQQYQPIYNNNLIGQKEDGQNYYQNPSASAVGPNPIHGYLNQSGQNPQQQQQPLLSDSFNGDPNNLVQQKGNRQWQAQHSQKISAVPQYPQPIQKSQIQYADPTMKRQQSQSTYDTEGHMMYNSRSNSQYGQNQFPEQVSGTAPVNQYSQNIQDSGYSKVQQRMPSATDFSNPPAFPQQQISRYPSSQSQAAVQSNTYIPEPDVVGMKSAAFAPQPNQENMYAQYPNPVQQQDPQQIPQQIHDNTYSFNNTFQPAEQQQQQQQQPQQIPQTTAPTPAPAPVAPQKKILQTSLDRNPNGISGDYSTIIRKKKQQQKQQLEQTKPKTVPQSATVPVPVPAPVTVPAPTLQPQQQSFDNTAIQHQQQQAQQQGIPFKDEGYGYQGYPQGNVQPTTVPMYNDQKMAPSSAYPYGNDTIPAYGKQDPVLGQNYGNPQQRPYLPQQSQPQRMQSNNGSSFGGQNLQDMKYAQPGMDPNKGGWPQQNQHLKVNESLPLNQNPLAQNMDLQQQQPQQQQQFLYQQQQPYQQQPPVIQPIQQEERVLVEPSSAQVATSVPQAPPSPKKRGKRGKKDTAATAAAAAAAAVVEPASMNSAASGTEVVEKTKQTRKGKEKTERKPRKKKNAGETEDDAQQSATPQQAPVPPQPALSKQTSGKVTKTPIAAPQLAPQISAGGLKSQESLELASQTSLGNAVHRMNHLPGQFNSAGAVHQPHQQQLPQGREFVGGVGMVMPAQNKNPTYNPQQMGDEISLGLAAAIPPVAPKSQFKKKTGPLINTDYTPLFVDLVNDKRARHLARMQEQDRMLYHISQNQQMHLQHLQTPSYIVSMPSSSPNSHLHHQQSSQYQQQVIKQHALPPQPMVAQNQYLRPNGPSVMLSSQNSKQIQSSYLTQQNQIIPKIEPASVNYSEQVVQQQQQQQQQQQLILQQQQQQQQVQQQLQHHHQSVPQQQQQPLQSQQSPYQQNLYPVQKSPQNTIGFVNSEIKNEYESVMNAPLPAISVAPLVQGNGNGTSHPYG